MITPHPRGDVKTDTIRMTENYLYQVYYDLESGKVVSSNEKSTADLGFECKPDGWHVILNTSDFMKVADMGQVLFGAPYDTTGLKMRFDKSNGDPDSTAIGTWFTTIGADTVSNEHVYAVNRGLDVSGNPLGLYQVIFDSLKKGTYYFRYAKLQGGTVSHGSVTKDPSVNYLFFSFQSGTVKHLEPSKSSYDLLFTQYTTMLFTDQGIAYPYLVTGVLLNRDHVEAVSDTTHAFSAITFDLVSSLIFSNNLDAIGYNWKYYSFTTGAYTIRPNLVYIIHGIKGYYYKLRFIGFYDKAGRKGYPVIEYQRL
jgi:hypothetical protein